MTYRWIGAVLILVGCGGFGFSMAREHRRQERLLEALERALKFMHWELQYRLTPLPELCNLAGRQVGGPIGSVLHQVSARLEQQTYPDVSCCMQSVLAADDVLPRQVRSLLRQLGSSLGRFDLPGQLEGLQALQAGCRKLLHHLEQGRGQRLRSYRTLGLCAGAALAILLL